MLRRLIFWKQNAILLPPLPLSSSGIIRFIIPSMPAFRCYHARRAAAATSLQHKAYHAFVIAFELNSTAVHFHCGAHIAVEQLFNTLNHIVVVGRYGIG